jgi:uncharacterized protein (UPF0332 family)
VSRQDIRLYIEHAHEMLDVAASNLANEFYSSAVNRAYYAIFYAANALLATHGLSRSKHSGVIAAFRQYFVKPGHIETEYGQMYAQVMDDRHSGDYDVVTSIEPERAEADLAFARRFVDRVMRYLEEEDLL